MKKIAIVIISYRRPKDTLLLLQNIAQQKAAQDLLEQVIIIDNHSEQDYSEVTQYIETSSLPFYYHYSDENLGVARGRNLAISMAQAPIVVTIDDDAYFKHNNALIEIVHFFESEYALQHKVGVLCFQVFYGANGQIQQNAFPHKKFDRYKDKNQFLSAYFIGCGHAILKEVYQKTGPYPSDFFYGMEEYDLGYRILDNGYSIAYDNRIAIIHNESPLGRTPNVDKMQMLWLNKTKVAYRYLPYRYFISTALMWSLQFLLKTKFNWTCFFNTWKKIVQIPKHEKRQVLRKETLQYIQRVEGRLWY